MTDRSGHGLRSCGRHQRIARAVRPSRVPRLCARGASRAAARAIEYRAAGRPGSEGRTGQEVAVIAGSIERPARLSKQARDDRGRAALKGVPLPAKRERPDLLSSVRPPQNHSAANAAPSRRRFPSDPSRCATHAPNLLSLPNRLRRTPDPSGTAFDPSVNPRTRAGLNRSPALPFALDVIGRASRHDVQNKLAQTRHNGRAKTLHSCEPFQRYSLLHGSLHSRRDVGRVHPG